jgi:hypothetical protein
VPIINSTAPLGVEICLLSPPAKKLVAWLAQTDTGAQQTHKTLTTAQVPLQSIKSTGRLLSQHSFGLFDSVHLAPTAAICARRVLFEEFVSQFWFWRCFCSAEFLLVFVAVFLVIELQ